MNGQERTASGNWVWSLPKPITHFRVATARTACSPLVLTTWEREALKRNVGRRFYTETKQKLWSFLFFSVIKQKENPELLRLNLTILLNNESPKRPSHSVFPLTSACMRAGLSEWIKKTLKERVWCLLNLPGCCYTETEVGPLPPTHSFALFRRIKGYQPGLCAQTHSAGASCLHLESLLCPVSVLLKLLSSPMSDFSQPRMTSRQRH